MKLLHIALTDISTVLKPVEGDSLTSLDLSGCSLILLQITEVTAVTPDGLPVLTESFPTLENASCLSVEEQTSKKRASYYEKHPLLPMPAASEEGQCRQKCSRNVTSYLQQAVNTEINALE